MSTLLLPTPPHLGSVYRRNTLSQSSSSSSSSYSSTFSLQFHPRFSFSSFPQTRTRRCISPRAFDSSSDSKIEEEKESEKIRIADEDYPSGEFEFKPITGWRKFLVQVKMLFAFPWERVRKGSVLTMKLRGEISDQVKNRFSLGLSLPQICENFLKAAYDPRISGIYLNIDGLNCGWGKVEEIRRHILNFKKSGKFVVAYVPTFQEKEYYLACACEEIYAPPSAYFTLFGFSVEASFLRGVFDKIGVEPQVERIGKYKSVGDQLARTTMSDENCEMLTALLDTIYTNWLDKVSSAKGKGREDIENFINEGVYEVDKLKEEGLISNVIYDDEVTAMLKERLGVKAEDELPTVDYRKYSRVRKWTVGISGGKEQIAIIRASGSISRVKSQLSFSSSGIVAEEFIEQIRTVRESEKFKAAIIRIDSPGGDALASDLMWREIRLLAASKPVIASMSDVAASGGYYMAMGTDAIVAESLTITGSIGVVTATKTLLRTLPQNQPTHMRSPSTAISCAHFGRHVSDVILFVVTSLPTNDQSGGDSFQPTINPVVTLFPWTINPVVTFPTEDQFGGKFNLGKLYEKIGFNKEIISRGRYAEVMAADQRSFRPDEAELFAKSAQSSYKGFRDKAALSRSMTVEKMEEVAQGRVWIGKDAASHGLVDAIGGLSRAIAIAKLKANIPQDQQVTVVEISASSSSLPGVLFNGVSSLTGVVNMLKELLQGLTFSDGVQARMDGIIFRSVEGYPNANSILSIIKDYISTL
ncbi:protease 4-like protein [Trifolium pratense]|uniref:Protease 4-like protein n=1 Tax=Trifolium pratense TaxID=57577 RepID=A0A2K3NP39_TRIPR|nr:protease 4-like protein [Trifolium pratense]